MQEQYAEIEIADIIKDREFRYRSNLDVDDLVESIKKDGQLVPIVVRRLDDNFQIISGFRRLTAMRKLGLKKVQAKILSDISDEKARRLSLLENLERNSLSAWDQVATAAKFRKQGMTSFEVSEAFNTSIRTIQRYLVVARAPKDFRRALERNDITIQQAYEALTKNVSLSEITTHGRSVRYLRGLSHKSSKKKEDIRIQHKASGEFFISIRYMPGKSDLNNLLETVRKKLV